VTEALDCDFDIEQPEGGIPLHAVLIEVDEGYPAILAFASRKVGGHLGVAATRRPRRDRTQQAHLRLGTALNQEPGLPACAAMLRLALQLRGMPASRCRIRGRERRRHCRPAPRCCRARLSQTVPVAVA